MKASLNWLKEFINVKASAQEVAQRLTLAGLEVEGISTQGEGLEKVFTATLLKCEKHPHADRLTLCEVRAGNQHYSLVCGAKNMKEGDRVALAIPGANLPNGMKIEETVIRQVKSSGMLCSEKELGLAELSEGILILPQEVPEGVPLSKALMLEDTVFEVNVTPNRGDCLSMLGLAREMGAAFKQTLKIRETKIPSKLFSAQAAMKVSNLTPKLSPRYTCRVVQGVKIGPSPLFVQRRLESCGIRAINNVVDATNYVMLELGQPLHAFDLSKILQEKIVVRTAASGEVLKMLDGQEYSLLPSDLVIADAERVLALAGVMGGKDSGVENETTALLLESACFNPNTVRKTAKRLGLQTESSYRFERGIDPNGCIKALDRLTELILEIAGASSVSKAVDVYPQVQKPKNVILRRAMLEKVLGIEIKDTKILSYLKTLGLKGKIKKKGEWVFQIPTFRSDLTREIDLVEEVVRLHGYNNIPSTFPNLAISDMPPLREDRLQRLRELLTAWGFNEVLHYSFTSPQLLQKFSQRIVNDQTLLNPISEEMSVMRPSLVPQMVQTLQKNIFNGSKNLKFFEIRPIYDCLPDASGIAEKWKLCLGISGSRRPLHFLEKEELVSIFDLKGYLNALFSFEREASLKEIPSHRETFHPKRQMCLEWMTRKLGEVGELHPRLMEDLGLRVPIVVAEIDLELLLTEKENRVQFQQIQLLPSVWRDLNLVVEESTTHGEIESRIRQYGGPWVRGLELFDIYRGNPLPEGKKALTYTIEYAAKEKTLTDEEVNQARESLLEQLEKETGATLR